jgi:exodeoxyribonuclease-3
VYKPNSGPFLERLEYRTQKYDEFFNEYVKKLQLLKPVVIFGDMNVAHN